MGIRSFVFILTFTLGQYIAIAQTFLLFNSDDLAKYDTVGCEDGQVYLLDYKTAFECRGGRFVLREGYVPYGMIADAVRRFAFE
ncbi:MAG: hypothetical protein GXO48_09800, partial [Chlorobi bacterium]|nr:hypothetical protein [Chlorobiota bacterium]